MERAGDEATRDNAAEDLEWPDESGLRPESRDIGEGKPEDIATPETSAEEKRKAIDEDSATSGKEAETTCDGADTVPETVESLIGDMHRAQTETPPRQDQR
jgi:hypothetical protein